MPKPVPAPIENQLQNFQICFWIWNILHYLLGLSAALGAALIAANKSSANDQLFGLPITLGIAVALATAALTFLRASTKANAYIQAWRLLHNEVVCFQLAENGNVEKLCEALRKAEELIGKTD
jgi:hypothetical protein